MNSSRLDQDHDYDPIEPRLFGCRIVALEYGIKKVPNNTEFLPLTGRSLSNVPVVYVFGPTWGNEQCCLCVSGFFPFFYVDWPESLNVLFNEAQVKHSGGLFWVLSDTVKRNVYEKRVNSECEEFVPIPPFDSLEHFIYALYVFLNSACQSCGAMDVVYNIEVVLRRSMYGYHRERRPFFKIYLLNFESIALAAQELFKGHFYGVRFQPYNVHLLGHQFMVHHNLFGMDILFVEKKNLKENSEERIVADVCYHIKSCDIWNQYQTKQIEPDSKQDRISLMKAQNVRTTPYLCCSRFIFSTALSSSLCTHWKDPCVDDFKKVNAPVVVNSLRDFLHEERRRRRYLGQPSPETLTGLCKKAEERYVRSIFQVLDEDVRPILEELSLGFKRVDYTFFSSREEMQCNSRESHEWVESPLRSPVESTKGLVPFFSNPHDISLSVIPKVVKLRHLVDQRNTFSWALIPLLTDGDQKSIKTFTYRPCVLSSKRTLSLAPSVISSKGEDGHSDKDKSLEWTSSYESAQHIDRDESLIVDLGSSPRGTASEAFLERNSLMCCTTQHHKEPNPGSDGVKRKLSVGRSDKEDLKMPSRGLLNLLRQRYRKRQASFYDNLSFKKPQVCLNTPSGDTCPLFGRILGIHVITETRLSSSTSCCSHVAANPRTDRMLGVVYLLRSEKMPFSLSSTRLDATNERTMEDRMGVVEVVDQDHRTVPFTLQKIPVSGETYRACSFAGRDPFLAKGTPCISSSVQRSYVPSEIDLVYWILHHLFRNFNPLYILAFNISTESLGYIFRRSRFLGFKRIEPHFGRLIPDYPLRVTFPPKGFGASETSPRVSSRSTPPQGASKLFGRIIFNLWKLLRETKMSRNDSLHAYAHQSLKITFPMYPLENLTSYWFSTTSDVPGFPLRDFVLRYAMRYVQLYFKLFSESGLLNHYIEQSKFLGIDLYSVMVRGSQYYVESLLFRAVNALGYVLLTPSKTQTAQHPALMTLPLILEPHSNFYGDPVIVLDFQSLYPSIMIAYNICFSTCLGELHNLVKRNDNKAISGFHDCLPFGVLSQGSLTSLREVLDLDKTKAGIFISPNQVVYVMPHIRRGILPDLMERVISTRLAIRGSIDMINAYLLTHTSKGGTRESKGLQATAYINERVPIILESRQRALKLFANCTYGYTAASFSGRMPCKEVAETIVQLGRQTLERAMAYIESHSEWGAQIVYGDTDSLFVLVKGKSLADAFQLGQEMTNAVTRLNPWPIELRMEKVYYPCFLLTKKRYVGWKYTSASGTPTLDAKGIETIRQDQCPAVSTCLTDVLTLLFKTLDLSQVKKYLMEFWTRMHLLEPYFSLHHFIFYRKLKLTSYAYHGQFHTLPPQAIVAYRMYTSWNYRQRLKDEPPEFFFEHGKRVPYVVVKSHRNSRLNEKVVPPEDLSSVGHEFFSHLSPTRPQISAESVNTWENTPATVIDVDWYIYHQIFPILNRYLQLVFSTFSIQDWYSSFPRRTVCYSSVNLSRVLSILKKQPSLQDKQNAVADYPSFNETHCTLPPLALHDHHGHKNHFERHLNAFNMLNRPAFSPATPSELRPSMVAKIAHKPTQPITVIFKPRKPRACHLCQATLPCDPLDPLLEDQDIPQVTHRFCQVCRSPNLHIWKLYASWNTAEQLYSKYMRLCVHCTGSRYAAESCHNAFHCPIYTARNNARQRLYNAVIDIEDLLN